MSAPAFHRYDAYGPVCGVPPTSGVNAADFDPPRITCRRCCKTPPAWWQRQVERRDGALFLAPLDGNCGTCGTVLTQRYISSPMECATCFPPPEWLRARPDDASAPEAA